MSLHECAPSRASRSRATQSLPARSGAARRAARAARRLALQTLTCPSPRVRGVCYARVHVRAAPWPLLGNCARFRWRRLRVSDVMKVPQFRLSAMSPRATPTDRDRDPIAGHNTAGDCWLVIHGKVYDVSQFMTDHPGGPESMLGACADSRARFRCRAAPAGRRMRRPAPCKCVFQPHPCLFSRQSMRRVCRAQRDKRVRRFVPLVVGAQDDGQVRWC
jgi:hypothetical protein